MALLGETLTDKEKAALHMYVFGGVDNWQYLYTIALPKDYNGTKENLLQYASRWKGTRKVKDYIQQLTMIKERALRIEREKGFKEGVASVENDRLKRELFANGVGVVDYSNPTNQTKKLNELINTAKDPTETLDALKVLVAMQKADKEGAKEGKQVRAYLPINCTICPLYLAEKGADGLHYADNVERKPTENQEGATDEGEGGIWR